MPDMEVHAPLLMERHPQTLNPHPAARRRRPSGPRWGSPRGRSACRWLGPPASSTASADAICIRSAQLTFGTWSLIGCSISTALTSPACSRQTSLHAAATPRNVSSLACCALRVRSIHCGCTHASCTADAIETWYFTQNWLHWTSDTGSTAAAPLTTHRRCSRVRTPSGSAASRWRLPLFGQSLHVLCRQPVSAVGSHAQQAAGEAAGSYSTAHHVHALRASMCPLPVRRAIVPARQCVMPTRCHASGRRLSIGYC